MNNFAAQFCPKRMHIGIKCCTGITVPRDDDETVADQVVEAAFAVARRDRSLAYMHPAAAPVVSGKPAFDVRHPEGDEALFSGLIHLLLKGA